MADARRNTKLFRSQSEASTTAGLVSGPLAETAAAKQNLPDTSEIMGIMFGHQRSQVFSQDEHIAAPAELNEQAVFPKPAVPMPFFSAMFGPILSTPDDSSHVAQVKSPAMASNVHVAQPCTPVAHHTPAVTPGKSRQGATPDSARSNRSDGKSSSIPGSSTSKGRASKSTMAGSARTGLTLDKMEDFGCNPKCSCKGANKCLYRSNQHERMALCSNVCTLWERFNDCDPAFNKGQALLDYMYENEIASDGAKKKVQFKLWPGSSQDLCSSCWRICAGFSKENGTESSLYGRIRAKFNAGDKNALAQGMTPSTEPTDDLKVKVVAFLDQWLTENSDSIPEDTAVNDFGPPRVHVDVPRKVDIWEACCVHFDKHYPDPSRPAGKPPISEPWFRKIMNDQVDVVIHKHKKFSQCVTCFLFKQLMAKCSNPVDRAEIRAHRLRHFDTVFKERVIYHKTRNYAKENPEEVLSMILDAQTAWRTRGPTLPREVGSGFPSGFEPFGQQLYGCLVHAMPGDEEHKGGFFGYMIDDSVKGGGNVTCEIVYQTLRKLQEHRKVWPPIMDIRLDNTTKDNKNKCVFGLFAWLVLTDVFKKVRVRYLSVGHTHEDIDALFGVLMQYLYRNQCFATIEILMDAIYESFFVREGKHASGNKPSAKVEHMRATHDWTGWLTTVCAEQVDEAKVPTVRKMEKYARRVPDSHRPHEFEFSKMTVDGGECVVVNYKHWCADKEFWNTDPIVVFNYKPDVKHLKPAQLNESVVKPLSKCVAAPDFTDDTVLCSKTQGPQDAHGQDTSSKLKACPRCKVHIAFGEGHRSSAVFTDNDRDDWAERWADLTQESANASLTEIKELRTYDRKEPRLPYVLPSCMQGPSDAYLSVPPVTYDGYTETMYKKLLAKAGVGVGTGAQPGGSTVSYGVDNVIGVHVSKSGFALLQLFGIMITVLVEALGIPLQTSMRCSSQLVNSMILMRRELIHHPANHK